MALTAFGLNCTLKAGPKPSSTQKLLDQVMQADRERQEPARIRIKAAE